MMGSLRRELMSAVDDVWAERLKHLPLDQGQQDSDRAPSEFYAILRTGERNAEGIKYRKGHSSRAGINGDGGSLRIDRSAFGDLNLRKGDKILAMDRPGEPIFEILSVDDRDHLRLVCELGDV